MTPVLTQKEYWAAVDSIASERFVDAGAEALCGAVMDLLKRYCFDRVVFLKGGSRFGQVAEAAAKKLANQDRAVVADPSQDELPPLMGAVICDALFEEGEDSLLREKRQDWIKAVNASGCPVVSLGVPAGLCPNTGRPGAEALHPQITLSLQWYLRGCFLGEGLDYCGEIRLVPMVDGSPSLSEDTLFRFAAEDAKLGLLPRKRTAHKGDSGKALLCVGSSRYVGAALLSAKACLAAGCGILYVACPDEVRPALFALPEAITVPVGKDWGNAASSDRAIEAMRGMKALGIGCGAGSGDFPRLLKAAMESNLNMVLDADGLNCLSRHPEQMAGLHGGIILTPHPGEMARLTGLSTSRITADPVAITREYAAKWGCVLLLKGAATVVSDGKRTRLIAQGNSGLGKGGSGDVLTGIITGLLAQGVEPFMAACLGSYLLGASAEEAFQLLRERMLRASHVIEALERQ